MEADDVLARKLAAVLPELDERQRRVLLAAEARSLGPGGVTRVARAAGVSRTTVHAALGGSAEPVGGGRVRAAGGGRKALREEDPGLVAALEALVEPETRGDPMSPLRWTCKSTRQLAAALTAAGHPVSHSTVGDLLRSMDYRLQANVKSREGASHPDRDARFRYLNGQVQAFGERGLPVLSVDTKKEELVGQFKNGGRDGQPHGRPETVAVHDFADPAQGKAVPYGIYDLGRNAGWVSVGQDHDTAAFAVESLRRWWRMVGQAAYPAAG